MSSVIGARVSLGAVWISAMSVAEASRACEQDAVHVFEYELDAFSSVGFEHSGSCQIFRGLRMAQSTR